MATRKATKTAKAPSKKSPRAIPTVSTSDKAQQAKWQAEDDVRTLQRAGEIARDKARLAKAQATATKQAEDLARIAKGRK